MATTNRYTDRAHHMTLAALGLLAAFTAAEVLIAFLLLG